MAMMLKYRGVRSSLRGNSWRIEILQESDVPFTVEELDPDTLQIEYGEKAKHEVVCSSTATLTVISPDDRSYIDLYSIKVGQIRMDVYCNDNLYWSGCLDSEFYEEPYSSAYNYQVSLTFSDFGILNRIPYDMSGLNSLRAIIEQALNASKIRYSTIDEHLISTEFENGDAMTLASLSISSENFIDEDGEHNSYMEVLKGIMQPLGLKVIQRSGTIYVYDLNGIMTKNGVVRAINWDGDDPKIGVDEVYNNIKVTFSPYSSAKLQSGEMEYNDIYGPEWTNLTNSKADVKYYNQAPPAGIEVPECYSFYIDYDKSHRKDGWDYDLIDFTIFRSFDSGKCTGLAEIGNKNFYFKTQPMLGGQEKVGVGAGFIPGHLPLSQQHLPTIGSIDHSQRLVMKTYRAFLPKLEDSDRQMNYIRIVLPLLFDPRYNPSQNASDGNEKSNFNTFKSYGQFAFVPVSIVLYDHNDHAVCHYSNKWLTEHGYKATSVKRVAEDSYSKLWGWKSGDAEWGEAWFSYYDPEDLVEGTGLNGWVENRQNFGKPWTKSKDKLSKRKYSYEDKDGSTQSFVMFDSFKKAPQGQFIPYPPEGGYLEVRVYNGVYVFDDTEHFTTVIDGTKFNSKGLYEKTRWSLYGIPTVSIARGTLTFDDSEIEDVEYSGVVNKDAQEPLELDTICGTAKGVSPSAKGIYIKTADGLQIQSLKRAGRTDHPEQLLIGTLYSQHAERHTRLSGTVVLDVGGLALYTEHAQDASKKFLMAAETQNISEDCSEAVFVELSPDEYTDEEG